MVMQKASALLLLLVSLATALRPPGLRAYSTGALREGAVVLVDAGPRLKKARSGHGFRIFNENEGEFYGETVEALPGDGAGVARCVVGARLRAPPPSEAVSCALVFAPPKRRKRARFAVEKAVELGCGTLAPVAAARGDVASVAAFEEAAPAWAVSAAEQCERFGPPFLAPTATLAGACAEAVARGERVYLCAEPSLGEAAVPLLAALAAHPSRSAALAVGPEGGWAPDEVAAARDAAGDSLSLVSLGSAVLRAETASLAALAVWRAHVDSGAWRPP